MLITNSKERVVEEIDMHGTSIALGRTFKGDYANSSSYIMEVMSELTALGIETLPNQTIGIFYDDPSKKAADLLMSFQGAFIKRPLKEVPQSFIQFLFTGRYLYIKLTDADIMKMIYEGYNMLFNYIKEKNIKLKSPSGYQVLSNMPNGFVAEILMEM
jgi:hypothetical protein